MIDLFGMKKKDAQDPSAPGEPSPAPDATAPDAPAEAHAPRGSHRLWAFLLVVDSLFVMVFGGVVASKVYHYWKAPAPAAAVPPRRHVPPKASEPAKAPEPPKAAEAPKAPEPAKTAEAPKPAPAKADAPRPPKPSLVTEAPKPRSTPSLAPAAGAARPAPAPAPAAAAASDGGKVRAAPVVFKLRAPHARSVQLVGAFIVHGGRKEMTKESDGVWSVRLYLNPGQYRYFFSVDKKKELDPENPQSDRGASLLQVQ